MEIKIKTALLAVEGNALLAARSPTAPPDKIKGSPKAGIRLHRK